MRRLIHGGSAAAVIAAVAAIAMVFSLASSRAPGNDAGPLSRSSAESTHSSDSVRTTVREVHRFDSLDTLVATADAVAVIRVKDVAEESRNDPDGGYVTTITLTGVVDELLFGELASDTVKMVFDGAYSDAALKGTDHDWTLVGQRVLIALHLRSDMGAYRPLNQQSVFTLSVDDKVTPVWADPLTNSFDGSALSDVKTRIDQARDAIQAGAVTPLPERPINPRQP